MTIECYYSACPFHTANQSGPYNGSFCDEEKCQATAIQLETFAKIRKIYLDTLKQHNKNVDTFVKDQKRIWFGQLFWWKINKFFKSLKI